jgi:hypothetical protein
MKIKEKSDIKMKRVRLELPEGVHRKVKVAAAIEGVAMGTYVRKIVEEYARGLKK